MHTSGSVYTQIMCRQYFSDKSVSCNLYEIAARPIGGFCGGGATRNLCPTVYRVHHCTKRYVTVH